MSEVTSLRVTSLHQQLEAAKVLADRGQSLRRLLSNRDFRKIILEGFLRDDAARLVQESVDMSLTEFDRANALALAQASGHLKQFLLVVEQRAEKAEGDILDLTGELDSERAEGGHNDE